MAQALYIMRRFGWHYFPETHRGRSTVQMSRPYRFLCMVRQHVMAVIILDHCNSGGGEDAM